MTIFNLIPIGFIGSCLIFGSMVLDVNEKVNNKYPMKKFICFNFNWNQLRNMVQ